MIANNNNYDERSAGGLVFKKTDGQLKWLLIKVVKTRGRGRMVRVKRGQNNQKFIYKLPKGHLNPGEYLKRAALREVEEEAKVTAKIIKKIGSNDYMFKDSITGEKLVKKVTFFLMEYVRPTNNNYSDGEKIVARVWLNTNWAVKKLAYESEKILLKKAEAFLEGK